MGEVNQGQFYRWVIQGDLKSIQTLSPEHIRQTFTVETLFTCECCHLLEGTLSEQMRSEAAGDGNSTFPLQFLAQLQLLQNAVTAGRCSCLMPGNVDIQLQTIKVKAIHVAAFNCQPHIVRYLLENGESINTSTGTLLRSALHLVALSPLHTPATLEVAMVLIQHGANLNALDLIGETPLHKAVYSNNPELVQLLIDKGCYLDPLSRRGLSPLFTAVVYHQLDIVTRLVSAGADGNQGQSTTPLVVAIRRKDKEMVKLLLQSTNCDPNIKHSAGDPSVTTPLHYAAFQGDADIVQLLVDKGAVVDAVDADTNTALMGAAFANYMDVARVLVAAGCDVNKCNHHGYTAMHHAAWEGRLDMVKLLMDHGGHHDTQTHDLNTPLALACHGNHPTVVDFLLQRPCNVNNADKDLDTPLHYTTYNGNEECTMKLIRLGADAGRENNVQATPLWNAVFMHHRNIVWQLLGQNVHPSIASKGIDQHAHTEGVTYVYDQPYTPLHVACQLEDFDTAKLLLRAGVDMGLERWLWDPNQYPESVQNNEDFKNWLLSHISNPPSLRQLCRTSMRQLLGKTLLTACPQFEIPINLKDYLLLKYL